MERVDVFRCIGELQFHWGRGPRVSNLRGPRFRNNDLRLIKNTKITEKVGLQFRAEFFNDWNWHCLNCTTRCFSTTSFDMDIPSLLCGDWNGNPRTDGKPFSDSEAFTQQHEHFYSGGLPI